MTDPRNEAYFRGFQEKCAEYGVDPSTLYVAHVTRVISPEVRTAVVKVAAARHDYLMAANETYRYDYEWALHTKTAQSLGEHFGNSLAEQAQGVGTGIKNMWNQSGLGGAVNMGVKAIKGTVDGLDSAGRFIGDAAGGFGDAMAGNTKLPSAPAAPRAPKPVTPAPTTEPVASQPAGQPPQTPAPVPQATVSQPAVAQNNNIQMPPALSLSTPAPTAPQWPPINLAPQTTAPAATTAQNNNIETPPAVVPAAQSLAGIRAAGAAAVQPNTGRMTMAEAKSRGLNFVQSNNTPKGQTTVMNGPGAQPAAKGGTINGQPVANYPLNRASGTNPIG